MKQLFKKYFSRKFIAAILGVATGAAVAFGIDTEIVITIAGAVMATASAVTYIVTEGKIDVERIKTAAEKIQEAQNAVKGDK